MSLFKKLPAVTSKSSRRVGRGYGSSKGGHTSSRGTKGQRSRSNGGIALWFEGGQLPLTKRLPWQRGKGRLQSLGKYQEVNLQDVLKKQLSNVTPEALLEAGLIKTTKHPVRVIGLGEVKSKLTFQGVAVSKPVQERIEKAGGSIVV